MTAVGILVVWLMFSVVLGIVMGAGTLAMANNRHDEIIALKIFAGISAGAFILLMIVGFGSP